MQRCVELSGEDRASIESDPSWRPDYTALLESDPALADSVVTCQLRPGDYMLWDDRMIHGNSAGRGPSPTGANLARAAIFLSMSPMSLLVIHTPFISAARPLDFDDSASCVCAQSRL